MRCSRRRKTNRLGDEYAAKQLPSFEKSADEEDQTDVGKTKPSRRPSAE